MPLSFATSCVTFGLTFAGVVCFAVTSFGGDIIFQLGWQLCSIASPTVCSGHLLVALGMMSLLGFIKLPIQLFLLRSNVNFKLGVRLALYQCTGAIFGLYILTTYGSDLLFKRMFGVFLFSLAIWYLRREVEVYHHVSMPAPEYEPRSEIPSELEMKGVLSGVKISDDRLKPYDIDDAVIDHTFSADGADVDVHIGPPVDDATSEVTQRSQLKIETWSMEAYIGVLGLMSGVLGGIYGTGGPPLMVFANSTGINKDEWRATAAFCYFFENLARAYYVLYVRNVIDFDNEVFLFFGLLASVVIGLAVGNSLAGNVSAVLWRQMILILLMSGSAAMMCAGAPDEAAFGVFVAVAVVYIVLFVIFRRSYDVSMYYFLRNLIGLSKGCIIR